MSPRDSFDLHTASHPGGFTIFKFTIRDKVKLRRDDFLPS